MKAPTLLLALALPLAPVAVLAADAVAPVEITIRDHRFEPAEVRVPAGKVVKLLIRNEDKTAEEFESHELHREKVIKGGTSATISVGPLKPGRYPFFGEFNPKTARGTLIAE